MPENTQTPQPAAANLEEFNLDAFIAGIVVPSKVVAVAQDRALGQQLLEAAQAITDLEQAERDAKTDGRPSKRRAGMTESPELAQARQDLAALEEKAAGTYSFVKVEALTKSVRKQALKDAAKASGDMDVYNTSVISSTAKVYRQDPRVHPDASGRVLSLEQWEAFSEAMGYMQWDAIIDATVEVANEGVSPDFSQPASPSPNGPMSSKS